MKKFILAILFCFVLSLPVFAITANTELGGLNVPVSPDVVDVNNIPENLKSVVLNTAPLSVVKAEVTEDATVSEVLMLMQGETPICPIDSPEFTSLLNLMVSSFEKDVKLGFEELKNLSITQDYIKLSVWGSFFNKYSGTSITAYPVGNIEIRFDDYNFVISSSENSKKLIFEIILPAFYNKLEEVSKNYPVKRYVLNISNGSLLKDYEIDLKNVTEIKTIYPFEDVKNNTAFIVGSYYGLTLDTAYVEVLRGYLEGVNSGYDRPVEGEYPGCVNVLAYVTLLKNVSNYTLEDKNISDFIIYENLAVCLDTKELINTADMTTKNKALKYEDYKLSLDNLLLTPINEDVVVIQPYYLECFLYKDLNKGMGRFIDVTSFIANGEHFFTVVDSDIQLPMEPFVGSTGYLETALGGSPFLIYYNEYVPYDRVISWLNSTGKATLSADAVSSYMNSIKEEMYASDRKSDYNSYLKAVGLTPDSTKLIIGLIIAVILISVVGVIVIIIKKKVAKSNTISPNSQLLFEDTDDDEDTNDINGSNFELK